MGKVNVWLKRTFTIVIGLIAIIGALLLGFALFIHGYFHKEEEIEEVLAGLHVIYVVAAVTLALAIIAAFGAYKEKKWALIAYTVGMILCCLFVLVCEIQGLASKPMVAEQLEKQYLEMMPLVNASENIVEAIKEAQAELECCGLEQGYQDWSNNIPDSCLCAEESTNPCVAAPRDSSLFRDSAGDQPIMIYGKACLPYIIARDMDFVNATLGVMLGMMLLWVLSVVLCVVILCRLNRKVDTPTVVYSQQAKAGNYTTLTDAPEYT